MTFSDWHPTYSMTEITRIMFSGTTVLSTWWRLERKFSVRCGQATGGSDSKTPSLLGRKYWHSFCTWTRLTSRIMGAQCIQYICRSAIYTYPSGIIADENWNCTNFCRQKLSGIPLSILTSLRSNSLIPHCLSPFLSLPSPSQSLRRFFPDFWAAPCFQTHHVVLGPFPLFQDPLDLTGWFHAFLLNFH